MALALALALAVREFGVGAIARIETRTWRDRYPAGLPANFSRLERTLKR